MSKMVVRVNVLEFLKAHYEMLRRHGLKMIHDETMDYYNECSDPVFSYLSYSGTRKQFVDMPIEIVEIVNALGVVFKECRVGFGVKFFETVSVDDDKEVA